MIYSPNGSPCIPTCDFPMAVQKCPLPNTETCLCPPGTVFDVAKEECVDPEECGCYDYKGNYYEVRHL